ncbi:MAG: type II toxin-antitoxin system BrnA family antitoxin [Roseiarcus sp.]
MKAPELDKLFDDGEVDVVDQFDWSKATRPNRETQRVNVDFPVWIVNALDKEAARLGVPRQALIKLWIAERLGKAA